MNYPLIGILILVVLYFGARLVRSLAQYAKNRKHVIKVDAVITDAKWLTPAGVKADNEESSSVTMKVSVDYEGQIYFEEVKVSYKYLPEDGKKIRVYFNRKTKDISLQNSVFPVVAYLVAILLLSHSIYRLLKK